MRTLINTLSQLLAALAGSTVFIWSLASLDSGRSMLLVLASVGAVAVGVLWSSVLLLHSLHVRVTRGAGFTGWTRPSQCRSLSSWLSHDWSFYSKGGRQEGMRVLGFEIAFAGPLKP